MIKLKNILNEAIKINAKTEDDLQKQLIRHGFGDYYIKDYKANDTAITIGINITF